MAKQIYINLPVTDLAKSAVFYEALGFTKNPDFSDDKGNAMMWSEDIVVMLITRDFYQTFLQNKQVANPATTSGVLLAVTLETKEAVQQFADIAKANGGSYYKATQPEGITDDMMFSYEVLDPDGNQWEPVWMNADFNPQVTA